MKKIKKYFQLALFLFLIQCNLTAQPFANDIAEFKKQDSLHEPPRRSILFVGSSSFRLWWNMGTYFPTHKIINRGFGGATIPDVILYEEDVIFKYRPKQIVIYCGENDIASSDTVSGKILSERFKKLFTDIRKKLPRVPVIYVSMKPCPSRWQMKERLQDGNNQIRSFLNKKKHTAFINVWDAMLDSKGSPREEIFGNDHLHMNEKGYAIWQKLIEPHLIKK